MLNKKVVKSTGVVIFFFFIFTLAALALEWQELKGEHFIVYFNPSDQGVSSSGAEIDFVKEVLHKAELYYQRIAPDLGYPRYSKFWTWEKRVKIYIYPDHKS